MASRSTRLTLSLCRLTLLFLGILTAPGLFAQTNTTALTGVVTDVTGALLPGATISLSSASSGTSLKTVSKAQGEFSFTQVTPGTYQVKVSAPGFSEDDETVQLLVATPVNLTFKLTVGSTDVVEVATNLAEINSTDATLGKAFDSSQVANLPYLANNVTYLLSLQPGVLGLDSGAQSGGVNTDSRTRRISRWMVWITTTRYSAWRSTARCARRATRWKSFESRRPTRMRMREGLRAGRFRL